MRITVRVPATSANLGPGFDCFGLALDLCNEVTVDTEAEPGVMWEGEGTDELPTDGTDMVSRAIADAARRTGLSLPALGLHSGHAEETTPRDAPIRRVPARPGVGRTAVAPG